MPQSYVFQCRDCISSQDTGQSSQAFACDWVPFMRHCTGSFLAFREKFLETTSLHSTVTQQDIANMVLFLCSDAGKHITGQILAIDGGLTSVISG